MVRTLHAGGNGGIKRDKWRREKAEARDDGMPFIEGSLDENTNKAQQRKTQTQNKYALYLSSSYQWLHQRIKTQLHFVIK